MCLWVVGGCDFRLFGYCLTRLEFRCWWLAGFVAVCCVLVKLMFVAGLVNSVVVGVLIAVVSGLLDLCILL